LLWADGKKKEAKQNIRVGGDVVIARNFDFTFTVIPKTADATVSQKNIFELGKRDGCQYTDGKYNTRI
jgi:hypothetical protein